MSYKYPPPAFPGMTVGIIRLNDDGSDTWINPGANPDWQEYQAWLAEGNTPVPYVAPPPPVPQSVTMMQGRLALFNAGLLDQSDAAVQAATKDIQIMWEYSSVMERQNPQVIALAHSIGLSDAQIDALFVAAAAI